MGRMILRDLENGESFRVYFDNGRVAQTMRCYPPNRYELLVIDAMTPLGLHENTPRPYAQNAVECNTDAPVLETLGMFALIAMMILLMGIVGGIEHGTLPV